MKVKWAREVSGNITFDLSVGTHTFFGLSGELRQPEGWFQLDETSRLMLTETFNDEEWIKQIEGELPELLNRFLEGG